MSTSQSQTSSPNQRRRRKFVLALDLGTTKIKASIFDQDGKVVAHSSRKVTLVYPNPGWIEICPNELWDAVIDSTKEVLSASHLTPQCLACMGISTQRATFVTWDRNTGREFHNFITWKDVRADSLVKEWNNSLTMKALRAGAQCLYFITRMKRFRVASILYLQNKMVNMRLLWALQNVPSLKEAVKRGTAVFGTVDTWLMYKFSKGCTYLTDVGCASATGLFDPFTMAYGEWSFKLFGIPRSLMPLVVDSAGSHFGSVHPDIFGSEIPIRAVMADQSAAVFGSGCLHVGDTKMTLGTGSFLDVNTGRQPHASINGLVPVVGWRYRDALCFMAEGSNHDTGSLIEWAKQFEVDLKACKSLDLFEHASSTSDIAKSVPKEGFDLFFVPGFFGLQAPILDPTAGAGFLGMTPNTGKKEMLRAILESIAFSMKLLQETMETESEHTLQNIQIDGGVSGNDFVVELISALTGKAIKRASCSELASFGVAFMAGLDAGVWNSVSEMERLRGVEKTFKPPKDPVKLEDLHNHYKRWVNACYRFTHWNELDQRLD